MLGLRSGGDGSSERASMRSEAIYSSTIHTSFAHLLMFFCFVLLCVCVCVCVCVCGWKFGDTSLDTYVHNNSIVSPSVSAVYLSALPET